MCVQIICTYLVYNVHLDKFFYKVGPEHSKVRRGGGRPKDGE